MIDAASEKAWRVGRRALENSLLCFERLVHIEHFALTVAKLPGAVAEFGCYTGYTSAFIAAVTGKPMYVFDSFEGLPEPTADDAGKIPLQEFKAGTFKVTEQSVLDLFIRFSLPAPAILHGWFRDIKPDEIPLLSFVHLDADLYESTLDALTLIYPKLAPGAVVILDDYGWERLPGVKKACDVFLAGKSERVIVQDFIRDSHQGYFIKAPFA